MRHVCKIIMIAAVFLFAASAVSLAGSCEGIENVVRTCSGAYECSFDGISHGFILDLPDETEGAPLVIMLHGYGQNAASFRTDTRFSEAAVKMGYAVAYVTGAPDPGDRTSATGWNTGMGDLKNRDTEFLSSLAVYLRDKYHLGRVFAAGFSNGAFMAHRLAIEAGDIFSAVISVAGTVSDSVWKARPDTLSVSLFQVTGEKDDVIPKNSDSSAKYSRMPAIEDVIAYYAEADGLNEYEDISVGKGSVLTKYANGEKGTCVWHLFVNDGRHSWPGERVTGIDTNALILEFLSSVR